MQTNTKTALVLVCVSIFSLCSGQADSCISTGSYFSDTNYSSLSFPSITDLSYTLFFPDLVFNCSGYVTAINMLVQPAEHTLTRYLLFQVWTNGTNETYYSLKHNVRVGTNKQLPNNATIEKLSMNISLPVDAGDVVGVYFPQSRPLALAYSSSRNRTVYQATDTSFPPCNVALCSSNFEVSQNQDYKLNVIFSLEADHGLQQPMNEICSQQHSLGQLCLDPSIATSSSISTHSGTPSSISTATSPTSSIVPPPSVTVECSSDACPPVGTTGFSITIISIILIAVVVFVILLAVFIVLFLVLCRKRGLFKNNKKVDSASIQHYLAQNGSFYTSISIRKPNTGSILTNEVPPVVPQTYEPGTEEIDALEPYAELRTVLPDFPRRTNVLVTSSTVDLKHTRTPLSPQASSMFDLTGPPPTHRSKPKVGPLLSLRSVPQSPNAMSMVNLGPSRRATVSGSSPFQKSPTPYMQPLSNPKSTEQIFSFRDRNFKKAQTHSCMSGISSPSSTVASPLLASVSENDENSSVEVMSPYQEPFAPIDAVRSPEQKSAFNLSRSPLVHDRKFSVPISELSQSHKMLKKANSVDFASPYLEPSPNLKPKRLMDKFRNRSHTTSESFRQEYSFKPPLNNSTDGSDTNGEIYSKLNREELERNRGNSFSVVPPDIYDTAHITKYREIPRHQISLGEKLGSGHFCKVYYGKWNFEGGHLDVAVKILKPDLGAPEAKKFLQEAKIMAQFLHQNVVHLHGVVSVDEPLMICLELMVRGDLKHYLKEIKTTHTNVTKNQAEYIKQFLEFCRQIASGMSYLANKDFVHRDLAARNVFLNDEMICKIGDFGMSRDLTQDEIYESKGHNIPLRWTAPEAVNYLTYTIASDVWSYGMLLFEIWSLGYKPFHDKSVEEVHMLISSSYCLPPPPGCPRNIYQLMVQCWNRDPSSRPSFSHIIDVLSESDEMLLEQPNDEVKSTLIGASLDEGIALYKDLQYYYYDVC